FGWGDCKQYIKLAREASRTTSLLSWWISVIARHPVSYLKHRAYYSFHLIRSMGTIVGWAPPYAVNSTAHLAELTSKHRIDMSGALQLWEPKKAYLPFEWIAAVLFSRLSVVIAVLACVITLFSNWRRARNYDEIDLVAVTSGGLGIGNLLM